MKSAAKQGNGGAIENLFGTIILTVIRATQHKSYVSMQVFECSEAIFSDKNGLDSVPDTIASNLDEETSSNPRTTLNCPKRRSN